MPKALGGAVLLLSLLSGAAAAQTFTLTFNGQTTAALPAGASAAQIQSSLNSLSSIGGAGGAVTVTQMGTTSTVTFGGSLAATNLAQMSAGGSGGAVVSTSTLTDGGPPSEVQKVTVSGASGTFSLTFNGATTSQLALGATAAAVQSALNGLSTIGGAGGSVAVVSSPGTYTVTFGGSLAGTNLPQMTGSGAGGATLSVTTLQDGGPTSEVQTATVSGASGTFTLTFNGSTTSSMAFNVSAATMQASLNGLPTIGGVGGSVGVTQNSNVYTITFGGSLAGTNVSQMTASGGGGTTVMTATQTEGGFVPSEVQQIMVTCSADSSAPAVTAPLAATATQTSCQ